MQLILSRIRGRKKRIALVVSLSFIVILIAARLALPFILKSYINKTLDGIEGFNGHVDSVHVALWRGAYELHDIKIEKISAKSKQPFFSANEVDVSLDWRALAQGRAVSKIRMVEPRIEIVIEPSKEKSQASVDPLTWQKQLQKLYPFQINRFAIDDGFIRFKNNTTKPKINFYASDLNLHAENISNTERYEDKLPSDVDLTGRFLKSGRIKSSAEFNLLTEPTELDLNASMTGLNLKELNEFAKAYGNFDFEGGKMNASMELAASKTKYVGYVKTVAIGMDILDWNKEKKEGKSVGNLLWQGLAGSIADVLSNQKHHQFAARIPLSGSRDSLRINSWAALGSILQNAFFKALNPKLENSVQFSNAIQSGSSRESSGGSK